MEWLKSTVTVRRHHYRGDGAIRAERLTSLNALSYSLTRFGIESSSRLWTMVARLISTFRSNRTSRS
jgi:hypothetical protein